MNAEKTILSFVAVVVGLLVAGGAFFIYQSTHGISPTNLKPVAIIKPSPTLGPAVYLVVTSPTDESVVSSKVVTVAGKTQAGATVVVTAGGTDQIVNPSSSGDFSVSTTIDNGENTIFIDSITPDGQHAQKTLMVTYSTEDF